MKPPTDLERTIQYSIRSRLAAMGIRLFRRNIGARSWVDAAGHERLTLFGERGQSDLWGVYRGRDGRAVHVEIEVKRPGRKPTPEQLEWLKEMTRLGAVAFWCDDCDLCVRIMTAILKGGRIVWHKNEYFDIEMPSEL